MTLSLAEERWRQSAGNPPRQLTEVMRFSTAVGSDFVGIHQELADLKKEDEKASVTWIALNEVGKAVVAVLDMADRPAVATSRPLTSSVRAATVVKATATNLVTKAAVALPVTTVQWEGRRLELAAGLLVSTLGKRSFAVVPVIENGALVPGQTRLRQSTTEYAALPMAFANWRLREWAAGTGRRAALLSFGAGINNGTAEFAAGAAYAIGSVNIHLMYHLGRDERLTGGLVAGQANPPPAIDAYKEKHWEGRLAVGLSYRVPLP